MDKIHPNHKDLWQGDSIHLQPLPMTTILIVTSKTVSLLWYYVFSLMLSYKVENHTKSDIFHIFSESRSLKVLNLSVLSLLNMILAKWIDWLLVDNFIALFVGVIFEYLGSCVFIKFVSRFTFIMIILITLMFYVSRIFDL